MKREDDNNVVAHALHMHYTIRHLRNQTILGEEEMKGPLDDAHSKWKLE
jgi:hypothetical protein